MYNKFKKPALTKNEIIKIISLIIITSIGIFLSYYMLKKKDLWYYEIKARLLVISFTLLFLLLSIYFKLDKKELWYISVIKILPSLMLVYVISYFPVKQINLISLMLPIVLIAIFFGTGCGIFLHLFAVTQFYFLDIYTADICIFYMIFGILLLYFMKYQNSKIKIYFTIATIFVMYSIFIIIYQYMQYESINVMNLFIGFIPLTISVLPIYINYIFTYLNRKRMNVQLKTYLKDDYVLIQKLLTKNELCYYHSLEVSDLASRVAKRMNANVAIVTTAARYHEIGRLISKNYISSGITILKEYKFPKVVIDIVTEHNSKTNRPRTIEAAIVMLADTIITTMDAIIKKRGIENINRVNIVKNIFEIRLESGILDDSVFSTKEYLKLKNAFLMEYKEQ